jgi:hypothetical protein
MGSAATVIVRSLRSEIQPSLEFDGVVPTAIEGAWRISWRPAQLPNRAFHVPRIGYLVGAIMAKAADFCQRPFNRADAAGRP